MNRIISSNFAIMTPDDAPERIACFPRSTPPPRANTTNTMSQQQYNSSVLVPLVEITRTGGGSSFSMPEPSFPTPFLIPGGLRVSTKHRSGDGNKTVLELLDAAFDLLAEEDDDACEPLKKN
jgi:hypothetical protein